MSGHRITSTSIAWITTPSEMHNLALSDDIAMNAMTFSNCEGMAGPPNPWIRIGTAEITVEIVDESQMLRNTVSALRTEQRSVRAEAEKRATDIDRQIQQLLAITNEVAL